MIYEEAKKAVLRGENPSGLDPVEYRVVILAEEVSESHDGAGLIKKTQNEVEHETWAQTVGYVAALSDMAFTTDEGVRWPCTLPKEGDKVTFAKYAGQLIEREGLTYRLVSDKDVLAVM